MDIRTKKMIGKLSVWGMLLAFLLWLGKQLLAYLWAMILPWLNWVLSWLMLVAGIAVFAIVLTIGVVAYFSFRSWNKRREEKKKENEKA